VEQQTLEFGHNFAKLCGVFGGTGREARKGGSEKHSRAVSGGIFGRERLDFA